MITKLILSDSFDGLDAPSVAPVKVARDGVDREWAEKERGEGGAEFKRLFPDVRPIKGKTILHVIAVGDEERYGDNRNGDGFAAEDNRKVHGRFKTNGHLFLDHKHQHPSLAVGEVLDTAYNDLMGRIELLLAADNDKAHKYLSKHSGEGDMPVSMGCTVDAERCSVCHNVAPKVRDRCACVRENLGLLMDDGRKVFMHNPDPHYFDISLVWRPADRIGYSLRKVANDQGLVSSDQLAIQAGLTQMRPTKLAAIRRVASIEKRISGMVRSFPESVGANTLQTLKAKVASAGLPAVLGTLHRKGWLLSPHDLFELGGIGKSAAAEKVLEDEPGLEPLLADDTSTDDLDGTDQDVDLGCDLSRECGLDAPESRSRVLRITIKLASPTVIDSAARGLADLYRHYKVAFAAQNLGHPTRLATLATIP